MAVRIDEMLQPGETVVYRAGRGAPDFLKYSLAAAVFMVVLNIIFFVILRPEPMESGFYYLSPILVVVLSLFFGLLSLAPGEVILTDRRLLRRRGLLRARITELMLGEVKRVHGLKAGSPRPVQVESAGGELLLLDGYPHPRQLGQAVAEAAGLPLPTGTAPIAERAAKVLILAGMYGVILGFFLVMMTLIVFVSFHRSDPMGIVGLALLFTMVVPGALGVIIGWILGSLLAILYLRPTVAAEELRAAIYADLGGKGTILQTDDFRGLGRRTLLRLGSLVYGQRIKPLNNSGVQHTR